MTVKEAREAYQLKLVLADTRPPVWRRLLVPANLSLARLHQAIQAAFGWEDDHGHVFQLRGGEYGQAGSEDGFELQGERVSLAALGLAPGESFTYAYGFEDGWSHQVTVEERLLLETPLRAPRCTGGRRACPPEATGGVFGFQERLAALEDPSHPEHGLALACFPSGWKAAAFEPDQANARLKEAFG